MLAEIAAAVSGKEQEMEEEMQRIEEQMKVRSARRDRGDDESDEDDSDGQETEFMRKERKKLKEMKQKMEDLARTNEEKVKHAETIRDSLTVRFNPTIMLCVH